MLLSMRTKLFSCAIGLLLLATGCGGGNGEGASGGRGSGGMTAGGGASVTGSGGTATGGQTGSGGSIAASGGATGQAGNSGQTGGAGALPGSGGMVGGGAGGTGPVTGGRGATGGAGGGAPGLGACTIGAAAKFSDAEFAYARFKTDLLTSAGAGGFLRVRRPNSTGAVNTTNSEGIAYGMLAAVYMNDQTVFDQLWKYEQLHLNAHQLMNWEINPEGTAPTPTGTGGATDGDEDMAFALIMADRKWGGRGTLADTYLNIAKKQIDLIWQFEVDHTRQDVLMPGDQFGGGQVINISYFAPAFYRLFGQVTGKAAEWSRVVESSYRALAAALNVSNGNTTNGLVPAWSTPEGVPMRPANSTHPINHQLDSSRTPFRIAQDYCWFAEPRALAYLQKIIAFYASIGAANIVEAYELAGTPAANTGLHLAAFVGPAGVGAMALPQHAQLRDQAYAALVTPPYLLGGSLYYNESWTVLSLLMLTGRYVDLTR